MSHAVRSLKFVASALVGTAVGTLVGLLVAPDRGAANRQNLRRIAGELSAQIPFSLENLRGRARRRRGRGGADSSFVQLYREGGG